MKKTLKITGIALAIILIALVFLVLTPLIFKEKFAVIVKNTANKTLKTEMNFSEMDVSFFHHFPELTITLTGFSLKSLPRLPGIPLLKPAISPLESIFSVLSKGL